MRGYRHVTGHRNVGAGFAAGLVVVVNRCSGSGARRGYTEGSSSSVGNLRLRVARFADRMCHGLRMPGQWDEAALSGAKLPRARVALPGDERGAERRRSCYHPRRRSRGAHRAQESRVDIQWHRADRGGRVPRDNAPRAPQLR